MRAIARTRPDALIRAGNVASTIDTLVLTGAVAATVKRLRARGLNDEEIRRLFEAELAAMSRAGGRRG